MTEFHHTAPSILFVDDEATAIKYFQRAIGELAPVATASSVEEGKRLLDEHARTVRVLISDQRMPGACGNELLAYARERYPDVVRILTTAYSELEQTVEAVNQGEIHRYLQKPWELGALRLEIKQALELARLRHEHTELVREKLVVRQQQMVGNRIGTLYALCAALLDPGVAPPLAAYLAAASHAGVNAAEPDWLAMDYYELIGAEAMRSAAFGCTVRAQLADMERQYPQATPDQAISQLSRAFGPALAPAEGGCMFLRPGQLSEYLESPADTAVSEQHAVWVASLLWLARREWSFEIDRGANGLHARLAPCGARLDSTGLAAWVEQF